MASPAVQGTDDGANTSAVTQRTVTCPTGSTTGDLIVCFMAMASSTAFTLGDGFVNLYPGGSNSDNLGVFYKQLDGSEGGTFTVDTVSSKSSWQVYRITGHANPGTQAPEATATGGASNPVVFNTSTPTGGSKDYLFMAAFRQAGEEGDDDTWANNSPSGYSPTPPDQRTSGTGGSPASNCSVASCYRQLTASSEQPGSFTPDQSLAWTSVVVAVHPGGPQTHTSGQLVVAATGTIVTAEVMEAQRQTAMGATAAVVAVPQRDLQRQVALGATADIASSGIRFAVLDRSAALDAVGAVTASGTVTHVFSRSAAVDATAAIASDGYGELARAAALAATADIASDGYGDLSRAAALDATGAVASVGQVVHILERSAALDATGATTVVHQRELFRQTVVSATTDIVSSGVRIAAPIERSASLGATGAVTVSAFQRDSLRSSALDATGAVTSIGLRIPILFAYHGATTVPVHNGTNATTQVTVTPPASMASGDLVVVVMSSKTDAPNTSVGVTGGQTWNDLGLDSQATTRSLHVRWCTFNGTWDASPRFDFGNMLQASSVHMFVWRPDAATGVAIDVDGSQQSGSNPTGPPYDVTLTGLTLTPTATVVLALWMSPDDDTYVVQTAGWTDLGPLDNLGGTDISIGAAWRTYGEPTTTGNVVARQTDETVAPDLWLGKLISWKATAVQHERSAAVSGTAALEAAPQRDVFRQTTVDAVAAVATAPQRELQRQTALDASAVIASVGQVEAAGGTTHERSAAIDATGAVASAGSRIVERSTALSAVGEVSTSGTRVLARAAFLDSAGAISAVSVRDLLRQGAVQGLAVLTSVGQGEYARSSTVDATASIASASAIGAAAQPSAARGPTDAVLVGTANSVERRYTWQTSG